MKLQKALGSIGDQTIFFLQFAVLFFCVCFFSMFFPGCSMDFMVFPMGFTWVFGSSLSFSHRFRVSCPGVWGRRVFFWPFWMLLVAFGGSPREQAVEHPRDCVNYIKMRSVFYINLYN